MVGTWPETILFSRRAPKKNPGSHEGQPGNPAEPERIVNILFQACLCSPPFCLLAILISYGCIVMLDIKTVKPHGVFSSFLIEADVEAFC